MPVSIRKSSKEKEKQAASTASSSTSLTGPGGAAPSKPPTKAGGSAPGSVLRGGGASSSSSATPKQDLSLLKFKSNLNNLNSYNAPTRPSSTANSSASSLSLAEVQRDLDALSFRSLDSLVHKGGASSPAGTPERGLNGSTYSLVDYPPAQPKNQANWMSAALSHELKPTTKGSASTRAGCSDADRDDGGATKTTKCTPGASALSAPSPAQTKQSPAGIGPSCKKGPSTSGGKSSTASGGSATIKKW